LDGHVPTLDVAAFRQPVLEGRDQMRCVIARPGAEIADYRHRRLLRARRERPCGYSAAEKCDKVPPPHGAYPKAKDHELIELIIAPCIAARSGHFCPLWVDGVEKVVDDLTKPFRLSILGLLAS